MTASQVSKSSVYPIPGYPITVAIISCVCCSRVAVATSHIKPYPSLGVNPRTVVRHSTE